MSATTWSFDEMDNDKVVPTIRIFKAQEVVINHEKISNKICVGRIDSRKDAATLVDSANLYVGLCEIAGTMAYELCKITAGHPLNCQCEIDKLLRKFKEHQTP